MCPGSRWEGVSPGFWDSAPLYNEAWEWVVLRGYPLLPAQTNTPLSPRPQDPAPFFAPYLKGPALALFSTDSLATGNRPEDPQGVELNPGQNLNLNTGEGRAGGRGET